jgi:PTH1 family peptidyl-tRNA hydrolase
MTKAEVDINDTQVLIVGLGNPGTEYAAHRHNVGFMVVDTLAQAHGLTFSRNKPTKSRLAEGQIRSQAVILAKPQTFMNLSGKAVARLSREHKISLERLLVVYDDLDLPLGRLRLRPEGGSGGHKGMRSIIESLGSESFPPLRVGIDRPSGGMDPADYVLQAFDESENAMLREVLAWAAIAVESWLVEGIAAAMDRFNRLPPMGTGAEVRVSESCQEKQA